MIDLLIAIGLMLYAGAIWIFSSMPIDFKSLLQIVVGLGGGAAILWMNKNYFLSLLKSRNSTPDKENDSVPMSDEDKDFKDFKALKYLKDRAIEIDSVEMLELVTKINNILFKESL